MEPKYLAEEVIVHPNHHLTRWLDPWGTPLITILRVNLVCSTVHLGVDIEVPSFAAGGDQAFTLEAQHLWRESAWLMNPYPPWDERYIYLHEWLVLMVKYMVNVGKYTIHGWHWEGICHFIFMYQVLQVVTSFGPRIRDHFRVTSIWGIKWSICTSSQRYHPKFFHQPT